MASKISRNLALEFIEFSPYNNDVMNAHSDHPSQNSVHDLRGLSVGEILRRTRLHYGRSLEEVESVLRIRTALLEALEGDDSSKLPGRVYAIGFIRSYAEYLGLDGDQIVELYKQQLGQGALRPEYNFPVAADESKRPDLTIFLVCIIGLIVVGGCYQFFKSDDNDLANVPYQAEVMQTAETLDVKSSVPTEFTTLQENVAQLGGADAAPKAVTDSVWPPKVEDVMPEMVNSLESADAAALKINDAQDITSDKTPDISVSAQLGVVEDDAQLKDVADAPAVSADKASSGDDSIRIVARDPTWMQIKDTEGKVVFTGILKKGHDIKVPAEAMGWRMDTGNAGGLDIYIGEDIIPPLGGDGIVVRRIPLFADALRDYAR